MSEDMDKVTLYVKGMTPTEMDDVWDDSVLNNAYDKALKIANEEVAKRIAMETNGNGKKSGKGKDKPKKEVQKPKKMPSKIKWTVGMPCRAIYEDDGLEYEAFIVNLVNDDECIIKFIGYGNSETVPLNSLKPSRGDPARMRQLEEAGVDKQDDGFESQANSESQGVYSEEPSSPEPVDLPKSSNKKSANKKRSTQDPFSKFGDLPNIPLPNMSMFRNMCDTPLPPPPPLVSLPGAEAEQQAISDMLLSWYMTGYYTGLYQGMKRQNSQNRRF